ncbi:MAG: polysaccharide biosynthesis tyrosine autokinase [Paludibacteraceae bacterium]|nr:polysaccharide biosynthesis tyrosine autokinase [Paludibacteraceae bacterium]
MDQNWNLNENIIVEDSLDFQELFVQVKTHWHWFVISMIALLTVAVLYILTTPSSYTRSAEVQIKSESSGGAGLNLQNSFKDMGFSSSGASVNNELRALISPDLMCEVIQRYHLDIEYEAVGNLKGQVLYGSKLPVMVDFLDITDYVNVTCMMEIDRNDFVVLHDFTFYDFEEGDRMESADKCRIHIGDTTNTPIGRVLVSRVPEYQSRRPVSKIKIKRTNLFKSQENWTAKLSVTQEDIKADIITLMVKDVSTQRGDAFLDGIISIYNENWVKDKNQIADGTSRFINERLKIIEEELSSVDNNISSYKSRNLLPDVKAVAEMYMQENANISNQLRELNSQLYMTQYIRDYLAVESNQTKVLPVSSGIQNANIEIQISEYNEKLLKRNRLEANSSSENDLVKGMDADLASMRSAILVSIDNQIAAIDNRIKTLKHSERNALSRISSNPIQAEMLLSAERQQAVKEALYLFLLQKREENELSQAYTAYNTRLIKRPGGSIFPSAPKKRNILFVAFLFGILIPLAILYARMSTNNTVRGRKDLEQIPVPLMGEIPLVVRPRKWWCFWKKPRRIHTAVVQPGNRNAVNEAFRVMRTNLEFLANDKCQAIMLTSFNAGSGKSFICVNTALSLAVKDKKVLMIDCDMRHASLSKWAKNPTRGLSAYLSGREKNLDELLVKSVSGYVGLDVLPVGGIPPNPTELIGNGILQEIIQEMRGKYDYILIDCPPIDIVADTQIIETCIDRTLFIVRAGLLERSMLDELTNIYNEQRFKNMSLILNGTSMEKGKFSYRYGYHSDYYVK